jgi:hypothetical protein
MNGTSDQIRRIVSTVLATLMLTLSVAVPLMERADVTGTLAVESRHDPSTCPHGHDHRLCTQIGANFSFATSVYHHRVAPVLLRTSTPVAPATRAFEPFQEGPPSRAPPLA